MFHFTIRSRLNPWLIFSSCRGKRSLWFCYGQPRVSYFNIIKLVCELLVYEQFGTMWIDVPYRTSCATVAADFAGICHFIVSNLWVRCITELTSLGNLFQTQDLFFYFIVGRVEGKRFLKIVNSLFVRVYMFVPKREVQQNIYFVEFVLHLFCLTKGCQKMG